MLEELLRFKDLQRLGVVNSWPQLRYMQQNYNFPSGLLLGVNSRAWRASDIKQWLDACPTLYRQYLAGFKTPKEIIVEDGVLPRTPTGKVQKYLLVQRFDRRG